MAPTDGITKRMNYDGFIDDVGVTPGPISAATAVAEDTCECGEAIVGDLDDFCQTCIDEQNRIAAIEDAQDAQMSGEDWLIDGVGFANPGGNSSLRAATPDNPRNLPCPTCEMPNMLTPLDKAAGYQCDNCADSAEFGGAR